MKLYATPLSHFSRKVRVLLELYGQPYEWVDVGNVAEGEAGKFGGNPLARVPVLEHGGEWLIDSDHICAHLARRFDPADRLGVLEAGVPELNARAVLNGVMLEDVTQVLARRTGAPVDELVFFARSRAAIGHGLAWLEERAALFQGALSFRGIHLACAWQHLEYFDVVPLAYPRLRAAVETLVREPALARTAPRVLKLR